MKELVFEELVNALIHSFGIFLSVIGVGVMIYFSLLQNNSLALISSIVYGTSLILVYSASTLLHGNLSRKNGKHIYNVLDYCAIYLLIAGTYTPFILLILKNKSGFSLLSMIWTMALLGILYQIFYNKKYESFSTITYVLMGWVIVLEIKNLINAISLNGILLLVLGGVSYTIGSIFFFYSHKKRFNHAVWHLFVLLGSILHYISILFYVMPFNL